MSDAWKMRLAVGGRHVFGFWSPPRWTPDVPGALDAQGMDDEK